MIAYKAFETGLICRGYQFILGKNVTDKANCVLNGFHCAENPLDMFTYYPDIEKSEYWIVKAHGDLDEDGRDSKISCTELTPVKRLKIEEVAAAALIYIRAHPLRSENGYQFTKQGYFRLLRDKEPVLKGELGEWLCFAKDDGAEIRLNLFKVDGEKIKAGVFYNIDGKPAKGERNGKTVRRNARNTARGN